MLESSEDMTRLLDEAYAELQDAGLGEAAQRLDAVRNGVFTTGSEWLGEMRVAVQAIRRTHEVPPEVDRKLKRLLGPSFHERAMFRQLWQGILTGTILAILGGAAVGLATAKDLIRYAPAWVTGAGALIALLWISARRAGVCPGCGSRIGPFSRSCTSCGTRLPEG